MAPPRLTVKTRPTGYAPGGVSYAKPKAPPKPKFYNPQGYVRGGAPLNVAQATQAKAMGSAGMVAAPYSVPAGSGFQVTPAAQANPDFRGYVEAGIPGDWEVQGAEGVFASRMGKLRSGYQQSLRDALIGMGLTDKTKLGEFGDYIDEDTITKAVANKYSTTAQIADQERKSNAQSQAALAARGILSSGETTNQATDIAAEGERGRFNALQQFLSGARTGLTGLADEEAGMTRDIATARANAAARLAQQYGYTYPAGTVEEAGFDPIAEAAKLPAGAAKPYVLPKVKATPKPAYNPRAYVPGGATKKVAKAIVAKGKKK